MARKTEVKQRMTNLEYSQSNKLFQKACEVASEKLGNEIKPTQRQASKYRNKSGSAFTYKGEASAILAQEKE